MVDILVIAAHPDDEVLGCGGAIAKHCEAGETVQVIFLSDGVTSREGSDTAGQERRYVAARKAAETLGTLPPIFLGFPDNRLDSVALLDVVQAIEAKVSGLRPKIIYTHFAGDLNIDHSLAHRATLTAFRPVPGSSIRAIYAYETPSSTEWAGPELANPFRPARYVGIDAVLAKKRAALTAYVEEMRPFPHPRSVEAIEALARHRGAEVGLAAAEAFTVIRDLTP